MTTLFFITNHVCRVSLFFEFIVHCFLTTLFVMLNDIIMQILLTGVIEPKRTIQYFIVELGFSEPLTFMTYAYLNYIFYNCNDGFCILAKLIVEQIFVKSILIPYRVMLLCLMDGKRLDISIDIVRRLYVQLYMNCLIFWPFVQLFNYYILPRNMQFLFTQLMFLLWDIYLALKLKEEDIPIEKKEVGEIRTGRTGRTDSRGKML